MLPILAEARDIVLEKIFQVHSVARVWQRLHGARRNVGNGDRRFLETSDDRLGIPRRLAWGHTPVGGVHSGWLKIFAECGIFGGILIIAIVGLVIVQHFLAWKQRTMKPGSLPGIDLTETLHINILTCASFSMLATMWVYDQYYINLGLPVSCLFFLMLAAPIYITTQGVAVQ